jgi:hypothetical protein
MQYQCAETDQEVDKIYQFIIKHKAVLFIILAEVNLYLPFNTGQGGIVADKARWRNWANYLGCC